MKPSRRSQTAPFLVMDVMEEARRLEESGARVLHLEVGQPSTGAPRTVLDALHRALEAEPLGYTVAQGDLRLRERIAEHYSAREAHVTPDDILITQGASGAFVLCFLAAFDAGDEVLITRPGYPCYRNILQSLDLRPVEVAVDETTGYQLSVEHLRALARLPRGIVIASPANPTGSVLAESELGALLSYCAEHGIVAIVDEIYHGLAYTERTPVSARKFSQDAFVINSFSKYFSMTGWRLGWMVSPPAYHRCLETLTQNLAICAPTPAQRAAVAAFDAQDELESHVARYRKNRATLLAALDGLGVTRRAPADGAFYIYADFSQYCRDTRELCRRLLHDEAVATTPGIDFDPSDGSKMVRLSYCGSTEDVEEAAARLTRFLRALPSPRRER